MVSKMAKRSYAGAKIEQRKDWTSLNSAMRQPNGDPYFRFQCMKRRGWWNWRTGGRSQMSTNLISSNRAIVIERSRTVKGSHVSAKGTSCKIRDNRNSRRMPYHAVWEGQSMNQGNQNARISIGHITLERGLVTSTSLQKKGSLRKTGDGEVVCRLRMKIHILT